MIYRESAKYLDDGAGTLRNRIYKNQTTNIKQLKQVYALVSKTIQHRKCLRAVIQASQMLKQERRLSANVAELMVYDLLIGSKRLNCGKCAEKDAVLRHKVRLQAEFVRYKLKNPVIAEVQNEPLVRWLRIRKNAGEVLARLKLKQAETWNEVEKQQCYYKDEYVDQLYALPRSVKVSELEEYKNGDIIIQDRASCFPVTIMQPVRGKQYIDACAAPGNKTSQLAEASGDVIAFERDRKRSKVLHKMLSTAKLINAVEIKQMDFTTFEPCEIEGLIVDPSCSGSGIFRATEVTPERLQKLAEFQYLIVLHALKFDANRVVYSTCSIHEQENELVVKRLLETPEVAEKWQLARALPTWHRRGLNSVFEGADNCVRVEPRTDGGIGFFAACFERKR